MYVVYNERSDALGIWAEGWPYVLLLKQVYAYRPGLACRLQETNVESAIDYNENWVPIVEF